MSCTALQITCILGVMVKLFIYSALLFLYIPIHPQSGYETHELNSLLHAWIEPVPHYWMWDKNIHYK